MSEAHWWFCIVAGSVRTTHKISWDICGKIFGPKRRQLFKYQIHSHFITCSRWMKKSYPPIYGLHRLVCLRFLQAPMPALELNSISGSLLALADSHCEWWKYSFCEQKVSLLVIFFFQMHTFSTVKRISFKKFNVPHINKYRIYE